MAQNNPNVLSLIPLSKPPVTGRELTYLTEVVHNTQKFSGDGPFTELATAWLVNELKTRVLLTTSCTHALEMAALLMDIGPGDEVIMPSFTFVSSANPFVLRGAKVVFVDIRPDTMNIDERQIEAAISAKTKAIVPVHYAGIACEMDTIMDLAAKYGLYVIEDAAQAFGATYKGRKLGTIGDFGCFSFHETKNISMGEGGAITIQNDALFAQAEIIREKGTNRTSFLKGEVSKYSWVDVGSSYLPSELNSAFLLAQLEHAELITKRRLALWEKYYDCFEQLQELGHCKRPTVPQGCAHNGHIFYLKLNSKIARDALIKCLRSQNIGAAFHYVPLHSSEAGHRFGRFVGEDAYTTAESDRLIRVPLFDALTDDEQARVITAVFTFFDELPHLERSYALSNPLEG